MRINNFSEPKFSIRSTLISAEISLLFSNEISSGLIPI